jgi:hypothetical protein
MNQKDPSRTTRLSLANKATVEAYMIGRSDADTENR